MNRDQRRGITLIECLICIAIAVMVIGMILPATRRVREPAQRMSCANNLKQIMLACQNFADYHPDGTLSSSTENSKEPRLSTYPAGCYGTPDRPPERRLSWQVAVLPYLERDNIFRNIDQKNGFDAESEALQSNIDVYHCPSTKEKLTPVTNYIAMAGLGDDAPIRLKGDKGNGLMGYDRTSTTLDITDGLSNTIAIAETNTSLGRWAQGGLSTLRPINLSEPNLLGKERLFGSLHDSGLNVAMCDGSVRFISNKMNSQIFADLVTIAGGEKVNPD